MKVVRTFEEFKTECKRIIYERDYVHGLVQFVEEMEEQFKDWYDQEYSPEEACDEFHEEWLQDEP